MYKTLMPTEHQYYVYIMASPNRRCLYTGMTNNLPRRIHEHKNGHVSSFTKKYKVIDLVYYEAYQDVREAIHREKCVKKWNRVWKVNRIDEMNPGWEDLSLTLQ